MHTTNDIRETEREIWAVISWTSPREQAWWRWRLIYLPGFCLIAGMLAGAMLGFVAGVVSVAH